MEGVTKDNLLKKKIEGKVEYKFPDGNIAKGIWKDNKPWDVVGTLDSGEIN